MKLIIECNELTDEKREAGDGIILALKDYAVTSRRVYSLEEIKEIRKKTKKEIFISINRNLFNEDIEPLKKILLEIDKIKIQGILFYDLAILQLKKDLNLKVNLVWNQTHMVNNYMTCDYYFSKGVKYALLGKEITLEEIITILNKSKITCMVEVVSKACIAFSKRKLLTNYYHDLGKDGCKELDILEKVSKVDYEVREEQDGTGFYQKEVINGTVIIKELFDNNCQYIIFREDGLEDIFLELLKDTKEYIKGKCKDVNYLNKYNKLGNNTNFFFKKTIYRVKNNEKN